MRKIIAIATLVLVAGLSINVGQAIAYNGSVTWTASSREIEFAPLTISGYSSWLIATTTAYSAYSEAQFVAQYGGGTGPTTSCGVGSCPQTYTVPAGTWYIMIKYITDPVYFGVSNIYTDFFRVNADNTVTQYDSSLTRIIATDPYNGEYVSTTTASGATVYVNPDDFRTGMYLSMSFVNNTLQNGVGGSALDAWNAAFEDIQLPLVSGNNNVSQNSTFTLNGQVNAVWRIKIPNTTPLIGSFLPAQTIVSTSTIFIVGERTALDIAMASTSEALITALLTGTTTSQSVIRCNPSDFDILICLISLIIPPQSVLQSDFDQLKDGLFQKWPLGYVTRLIEILSASTTRSIPVLSATLPAGVIGAGSSVTLDANHALDYILNATTSRFTNASASSTRTFYEITNDYWEIFVYICLGLYILRRILGSHLVGHVTHKK